jgi:hypothetical protein
VRHLPSIALAWLIAACGSVEVGTTVDGWDLGVPVLCHADECAEAISVATEGLELEAPDHLPIAEIAVYNRASVVAHQPTIVVLFKFADGSARAIGVGSVGIGAPVPWSAPDRPFFPGGRPPAQSPP